MPHDVPFPYQLSFDQSVESVCRRVSEWLEQRRPGLPDFSDSEDAVYIKNRDRVVVYVNEQYFRTFPSEELPVGRRAEMLLEAALLKVSRDTDELLEDGYRSLELDHIASAPNGESHLMRTFKRSLAEYGNPGIWTVGITRSMARLGRIGEPSGRTLADYARLYRQLSPEEAEMCRLYALGESTKAIAEAQGVTPRTIELRRQRILETFGFHRPVEIVKLLVRLQSNGHIDIDV